jgi:hypothetical protein
MASEVLDPAARAREKAASRAEDARALAAREKSHQDLEIENAAFAFPPERVRIDFSKIRSRR